MSKIIIAGGGTGGHIFPALAIANELKQLRPSIEILFVGAKGKMEMEKIPQAGYKIIGIDIAGFNRSTLIKNIGLPFKLIKSFLQVRDIIKEFKPDGVIGVGGYSSFPVLRYAQSRKIPTFLHESNSYAGTSNILLGKKATKIFVATEGMQKFFPSEKLMVTGNPIRRMIAHSTVTRSEAIHFFKLEENKKTVLVVGGSLGAKSINDAVAKHIDAFEKNQLQLIWQTGKTTAAKYVSIASGRKNIWVKDFIYEMEMAYAAADAVISRAGAMAVSELCIVKKPVIFVPYPNASEDHQTANAMYLVNKKAALVVKDGEAPFVLVDVLMDLMRSERLQTQLKENIVKLAIADADKVIAKEILKNIA
jgi:UDP-N-acetylglucosamine--N-acetylmuramyl-(pentapeptide) pyrophosphoryl-undecaprenol N-acetylglucosamine transferase